MTAMASRPPELLLLDRADIEAVAPSLPEIVEVVEETYRMDGRGEVEVPVKVGVHPGRAHSFLHAMPAWVAGERALGMKWISYYPGNTARGFPDSSGLIVLNDPHHGHPVAILEGMWITLVRTAACGAVAARYCARSEAGPSGTGRMRRSGEMVSPGAVGAVSLAHGCLSSRRGRGKAAKNSAPPWRTKGQWTLSPTASVEDAVRDMDIVVSSIPQGSERPLKADWWTEGMLAIPLDVLTAWEDEAFETIDMLVADNDAGLRAACGAAEPRSPSAGRIRFLRRYRARKQPRPPDRPGSHHGDTDGPRERRHAARMVDLSPRPKGRDRYDDGPAVLSAGSGDDERQPWMD